MSGCGAVSGLEAFIHPSTLQLCAHSRSHMEPFSADEAVYGQQTALVYRPTNETSQEGGLTVGLMKQF